MKLNNLAVRAKHTALFAFIAMMAGACTSSKEKLNKMDAEIARLEAQIDSTQNTNEARDSAAHNPMLQVLWKWIEDDAARIDSLRERNMTLGDSVLEKDLRKVALRYPLSAFLSKADLKTLQSQLRDFHNDWNAESAKNIIAGRGTLLDLHNVIFDLDYYNFEPPFHIINDAGHIRFNNARLDEQCRQFEMIMSELENEDVSQKIKRRAQKIEFDNNNQEIKRFERMCEISDSVYMNIQSHFAPQIQQRIDSLTAKRNTLRKQRNLLAARIHQK